MLIQPWKRSNDMLVGVAGLKVAPTSLPPNGLTLVSAEDDDFTAVSGVLHPVDLSGADATFEVTFPSEPAVGDRFGFFVSTPHAAYTHGVKPVVSDGPSIRGVAAATHDNVWSLWATGEQLVFWYDGTTWQVEDGRIPHSCKLLASSTQTLSHDTATKLTFGATTWSTVIGDLTNSRAMVRRRGRYRVAGLVSVASVAADTRIQLVCAVGNPTPAATAQLATTFNRIGGATVALTGSLDVLATASQYIQLTGRWDVSGGSGTKDTTVAAENLKPSLCVEEILF